MCQSWANGSAVLEEVADATRQSPPGPLPRCLPSFWAARPLPLQRASSTVAEEVWGGRWHCKWLWGCRGRGDGGAGREPSGAWRPLLEAPPSEVTAVLTGRALCICHLIYPSQRLWRQAPFCPRLWDKGPEAPRACEVPSATEQARAAALQMRWGPGWGRAASSIIESQEMKKALLSLQQNVGNTPNYA